MSNEYKDSFSSVIRFCTDFATDAAARGWSLEVKNFDASNDPQNWPTQDCIGISEFDFELDDGTIEVNLMFILSTFEDTNNFRLTDQMNMLVNRLIPGQAVKLYNSTTGTLRGHFAVRNGTRVAPPLKLETRTAQGVMVKLLSDQILRP